jgi:hypothetical protein
VAARSAVTPEGVDACNLVVARAAIGEARSATPMRWLQRTGDAVDRGPEGGGLQRSASEDPVAEEVRYRTGEMRSE